LSIIKPKLVAHTVVTIVATILISVGIDSFLDLISSALNNIITIVAVTLLVTQMKIKDYLRKRYGQSIVDHVVSPLLTSFIYFALFISLRTYAKEILGTNFIIAILLGVGLLSYGPVIVEKVFETI
jgi:hypothetical protein